MNPMTNLYLIHSPEHHWFKIGITDNVTKRFQEIQYGVPFKVKLLEMFTFVERKVALAVEKELHRTYKEQRLRGEWFSKLDITEVQDIVRSYIFISAFLGVE